MMKRCPRCEKEIQYCEWCGREFDKIALCYLKVNLDYLHFCSNRCYEKWLGKYEKLFVEYVDLEDVEESKEGGDDDKNM